MMKKTFIFLSLATIFLVSATCSLAAPNVYEIVNKSNIAAYYAGKDSRATANMTITDSQGDTSEREFVIMRHDDKDGGEQQFYIFMKKPKDARKIVLLVQKHPDKLDDRWIYFPSIDLAKSIAPSDKRTTFLGAHFYYEDLSGRNINEDWYELAKEEPAYYVVKCTPNNPVSVEFSYALVWIDKKTFLPMKTKYFDKAERLYRVIEALDVENIQGHPTITKSKVEDLATGGETVMELRNVSYDIGLDPSYFTERYMFKPPREVYYR